MRIYEPDLEGLYEHGIIEDYVIDPEYVLIEGEWVLFTTVEDLLCPKVGVCSTTTH